MVCFEVPCESGGEGMGGALTWAYGVGVGLYIHIQINTQNIVIYIRTCQNVLDDGRAQFPRLDLQRLVLERLLRHLGGVLGEERPFLLGKCIGK